MFSYRPESAYLERTSTSLSWYAFKRTATAVGRGFAIRLHEPRSGERFFRAYGAHGPDHRQPRPFGAVFCRRYAAQ
jgi:hypothetical protein